MNKFFNPNYFRDRNYFLFLIIFSSLYILPFLIFTFDIFPNKLHLIPLLIFTLLFFLKRPIKIEFILIVITLLIFIFFSLIFPKLNITTLLLGLIPYIAGLYCLVFWKNFQLTKNRTELYFKIFLWAGLLQLPVNIYLLMRYASVTELLIVDLTFGTFGNLGTTLLGIYTAFLIAFLFFKPDLIPQKIYYWLSLIILSINLAFAHAGGALLILILMLAGFVVLQLKKEIFYRFVIVIIISVISSVTVLKFTEYVIPEEKRNELNEIGNVFTHTLGEVLGNAHVIEVADRGNDGGNTNKMSTIFRAVNFADEEGNVFTGTQTGILNKYIETGIQTVDTSYLTLVAFPGFYTDYTSGYAISLGESGVLGTLILLAVFVILIHRKNFFKENRNVISIRIILILAFLICNAYVNSFLDLHFIFLWGFIYFILAGKESMN